jgi:cysteinyl-tRNA synthetase
MVFTVFNTLSRQKEQFIPLHKDKVGMYTCGPTVYNFPHIGNYRAYAFGDLLKRYLRFKGFKVTHVMNITDVDDKTIRDSRKEGVSLRDFTTRYTQAFFEDLQALRITDADTFCRATDHIQEMISIVSRLLEKGMAYKGEDGSVYFKVSAFDHYGKLAHLDLEALKAGASGRVKSDEYTKENAHDFALWKAYSDEDGDVVWDAPFGRGRPGWHIECSAMSSRFLGDTFDIHTGGVDLIFPHHQNEIAQSEGASGKPFVKYWMHNEWLLVDGEKMSKSKGNFYTLRDLLKRGFSPLAVKYVLVSSHYRQQLNFTFDGVKAAESAIERLQNLIVALQQTKAGRSDGTTAELVGALKSGFEEAMDDDLNVSEGLAVLFDFVKEVNGKLGQGDVGLQDAKIYLDALKDIDSVFGVMSFDQKRLDEEIDVLVQKREEARKKRDFKTSDSIRDELKAKGIVLEDTSQGVRWKRA